MTLINGANKYAKEVFLLLVNTDQMVMFGPVHLLVQFSLSCWPFCGKEGTRVTSFGKIGKMCSILLEKKGGGNNPKTTKKPETWNILACVDVPGEKG